MNRNLWPHRSEQFVKLNYLGLTETLLPMVAAKTLTSLDVTVLTCLASFGRPTGYRVKATARMVSEQLGRTLGDVKGSLARLGRAGVLCAGRDETGGVYYVIEPSIIEFNSNDRHTAAAIRELDRAKAERQRLVNH